MNQLTPSTVKKITLLLSLALAATLHAAEVENLRCEYLENPLGIDVAKPRLSWVLEDDKRGQKQNAYQILVASSPEILAKDQGDLWDSGKVVGDQSIQVEYAGKPLESQKACHWKVRVWDKDGEASDWAAPAQFVTGKMKPDEWSANWIAFPTRKERLDLEGASWIWALKEGENSDSVAPGACRMTRRFLS